MKTTVDLPDDLLHQINLRAHQKQQKLDDTLAELLQQGLDASTDESSPLPEPVINYDPHSGLPYIECRRRPSKEEELTPDRVAEILLQQEVAWHHAAR